MGVTDKSQDRTHSAVSPQTDAERLFLEQLGKEGGIRPEFARFAVAELQKRTAFLAAEALREVGPPRVSFDEAVKILGNDFDLVGAKNKAREESARWGLVGSPEEFDQIFANVTITGQGLGEVKRQMKEGGINGKGVKMMAVFDPGDRDLAEMVEVLLGDADIKVMDGVNDNKPPSDEPRQFDSVRKFGKTEIEAVRGIQVRNRSRESMVPIYDQSQPPQLTGPRIIFTPDVLDPLYSLPEGDLELRPGGTLTPLDFLLKITSDGLVEFMDPVSDLIRLRAQLDDCVRTECGQDVFNGLSPDAYVTKFLELIRKVSDKDGAGTAVAYGTIQKGSRTLPDTELNPTLYPLYVSERLYTVGPPIVVGFLTLKIATAYRDDNIRVFLHQTCFDADFKKRMAGPLPRIAIT